MPFLVILIFKQFSNLNFLESAWINCAHLLYNFKHFSLKQISLLIYILP